ncbi:hypothetical protein tinsulaeT_15530 [Thalassotalea insulae]|uniref:PEP-CTERM system TPR-repeat protein PrsT n=2 Tax=Thalassotalea insulae TaxID=2056778 RepID=A0ABQ6GQG6_9GAMM|nr:hypothetical protein tinsulaeT_15530 [Thalassotalea insulae]
MSLSVRGETADQLYEEALQAFNQKEYAQSIVLLKNTMFENPRHLSGRILLGKTYLLLSEFANAEKQFKQALTDGADSSQILIPLGQSLLLQGKYQELLDTLTVTEQTTLIATEIFSLRGRAFLELTQYDLAKDAFDSAIARGPQEAVGYLGLAILALKQGNISVADKWIDKVFELEPDNAEALQLKGDIYYQQGKLALATTLLNQSLMVDDHNLRTRLLLAEIYIAESKIEQALEHISFVLELKPNYPNVNLLYAFALFKSEKKNEGTKVAKNISSYLSKLDSEDLNRYPSLKLIQGISLYMQESWENAYSHLNFYAKQFPGHEQSHLMVANMDIKFERYQSALEILEHYNGEAKSLEYWQLNLAVLVKLGKFFEALVVVDHALAQYPEQLSLLEYKSKLFLATNNLSEALILLEKMYQRGEASEQLAILLGQLQLSMTQVDKAAKIVSELLAKQPDNPVYLSLSAGIDLQNDNSKSAGEKLRKALTKAPKMLQLYVNLYYVYMMENQVKNAADILNQAYKISPNQPLLLVKLAELSEKLNNFNTANKWRERLYQLQPDDADNLVHYADNLMKINQDEAALKLLLRHRIDYRLNAQYLSRLAAAHLKLKQCSDVDQVLGVLYGLSLNNAKQLVAIADMYLQCRRFELAHRALSYAESLDINNENVQLMRARWLLDINQAQLALKLLQPIAKRGHKKALQLEISAFEFLENYQQAILSAQQLYSQYPLPIHAYKLFTLLVKVNKHEEATALLEQYLSHSDNVNIRRVLAKAYLNQGNKEKAVLHFTTLAMNFNDAESYRQLAILLSVTNLKQAVDYAKKARELNESSPAIAATYGWLLVQFGQAKEGLAHLRFAYARNANQPTLMYRIGETLLMLGKPAQAKQYFQQAVKFDFPDAEKARLQLEKLID